MIKKQVNKVIVEYVDGGSDEFIVDGFYKETNNNVPRELRLDRVWTDHEIRWCTRQEE